MTAAAAFSATYREARDMFLAAMAADGGRLESVRHPRNGPDGEPLFLDIGLIGDPRSRRMLVILSGTHGVEGHCGSGAQVALLRDGVLRDRPADTAVLLLHAVNPYGFAWSRRVTHENIDLNRNWIDFDQPVPANPGYDAIHAMLCPREWTGETPDAIWSALGDHARDQGEGAMRRAASGGQYHHTDGLYFGGHAPSWSRVAQTDIFTRYMRDARTVAIIDLHSGLGPYSFGERLTTLPPGSRPFRLAAQWYGADLTSTVAGTAASPPVAGDGLSAAQALLPGSTVIPIALEFGTLPRKQVVTALCGDAWLHQFGDPHSDLGLRLRAKLRDAFYCDEVDWKAMIVAQTRLCVVQALAGLRLFHDHP
jgi:hypothetical protein